jgi:hypothetical protein
VEDAAAEPLLDEESLDLVEVVAGTSEVLFTEADKDLIGAAFFLEEAFGWPVGAVKGLVDTGNATGVTLVSLVAEAEGVDVGLTFLVVVSVLLVALVVDFSTFEPEERLFSSVLLVDIAP